jgi:hypothetical protein
MFKKVTSLGLTGLITISTMLGCSSGQLVKEQSREVVKKQEPVTLTVSVRNGFISEEEIQRYVTDPVLKKILG